MAIPAHRQRLAPVDGLRGLAALMIVTYHIFLMSTNDRLGPIDFTFVFLRSGVDLFFILSGFCLFYPLTGPEATPDWRAFFVRRARRILPPYYAALAALLLLPYLIEPVARWCGLFVTPPTWVSSEQLVTHLALVQTLFPNTFWGITGPFWSIGVEAQLYLVFPLAAWLVLRHGWRGVALMAGASVVYRAAVGIHAGATPLLALVQGGNTLFPEQTNLFLGRWLEFGAGMLIALLVRRTGPRHLSGRVEAGAVAGAFCLYAGAQLYQFHLDPADRWPPPIVDLLLSLAFGTILLLACTRGSRCGRALAQPQLVWIGTISYSLYLLHYAILQSVSPYVVALHLSRAGSYLALGVLGVPLAIACAAVFHQLFERPFMIQKRSTREPADARSGPVALAVAQGE